jgi:His/Glu/Gln/Arg/opine family amino acid ABC transporter permease subunit
VIKRYYPDLLSAAWVSIYLCGISLVIGAFFGLILCVGKLQGRGPFYRFSTGFIDFFRTIPEMVVVFWVYFCLPLVLTVRLSGVACGIIALSVYAAAFLAEIFRAGVQSIPRGQIEAAQALGIQAPAVWWKIIAPQAARNMLPPFMNFLTELLKSSALLSAIGVEELVYRASILGGQTYRYVELLTAVAMLYFAIIFPLSLAARQWETHLARGGGHTLKLSRSSEV